MSILSECLDMNANRRLRIGESFIRGIALAPAGPASGEPVLHHDLVEVQLAALRPRGLHGLTDRRPLIASNVSM
jgi:hypothetical protein